VFINLAYPQSSSYTLGTKPCVPYCMVNWSFEECQPSQVIETNINNSNDVIKSVEVLTAAV